MHGEMIGFAQSPGVAIGYLMVALFLAACAKFAHGTPLPAPKPDHG